MHKKESHDNAVCRLCGAVAKKIGRGPILSYTVDFFECQRCRYVETEQPYWLEEAYQKTINISDTGILKRNISNARIVLGAAMLLGRLKGRVVDSSGGYGILVRLLRDYGMDALWSDPFCENLVACGFEYEGGPADIVTSFEAFEHFLSPGEELDRLLKIAPTVILSTVIISDPAPEPCNWWYYGSEHGQHIGFFRKESLEYLAKERGLYLVSDGRSYHCFSARKINTLVWKALVRLNPLSPLFKAGRLPTRVWSDHLKLSGSEAKD